MTQLCALDKADLISKLKSFGGVPSLKESLGSAENPNFDKLNSFMKAVIEAAPASAIKQDVINQLQPVLNNVFKGTTFVLESDYIGNSINNFWPSSPKITDTKLKSVNSSNPNVTDNSDNPKSNKTEGIGRYFSNINHIKEFNSNFRDEVNELLFEYTNMDGIILGTTSNHELNEAIKILKNGYAAQLVKYLKSQGVTKLLNPNIYDPETLTFNETAFNELISEAEANIKSDNYFIRSGESDRFAFSNLELLRNFDNYVSSEINNVITIEKGYKNSNFEPANGIKYTKSNKLHVDKHFGDENSADIFNHTNDSIRMFIESIPYYDNFSMKTKRIQMNQFNTIFAKLNQTMAIEMAEIRISPEEKLIKALEIAISNPAKVLEDRGYFKDQLEGIYKKFKSVYERERNTKFGNNLYPMLANYINKLTTINYTQSEWDRRDLKYKTEVLSNQSSTRLKSNLEKQFQTHSKYNTFNFSSDLKFQDDTFVITTSKGIYTIPFDGSDMTILDRSDNTTLTEVEDIYQFIMNDESGDNEFTEVISDVFAKQLDAEVITIAYTSYKPQFMKVFNLMGNILLNNEFSQGTKIISGPDSIARNVDYFVSGEGSQFRSLIESSVVKTTEDNDSKKTLRRIFDQRLGTLRVAGFNHGDVGRDVIYKSISDVNGDSTRSYAVGASGNMMSLTRLPNLVNADKITFAELYKKKDDSFTNHNIFSETFDVASDTQLKTTVKTKDGTISSTSNLSVADLIASQIMFDYAGTYDSIYVQPVTYADKSQVWLKGIKRNAAFEYEDLNFSEGIGKASINMIQQFHYRTMSKMFQNLENKLVDDFNILFKFLIPDLKEEITSYEEGVKQLSKYAETASNFSMSMYNAIKQALDRGYNLEIYPEIHYCTTKKEGIQPNETLIEQMKVYSDFNSFKKNQLDQKKLWAYIASKEGFSLEHTFANGQRNSVLGQFGENIPDYANNWIDDNTGEFIIFKIKNKKGNYVEGEVKIKGETYDSTHYSFLDAVKFDDNYIVELNPEIDKFFEINGLVTNHYMAATVGLPYIHPAKTTFKTEYEKLKDNDVFSDELYQATARKMEAIRTSAHSKRMVILGATIHPFIQQKFDGIPTEYNISCIQDKITNVFNLQGGSEAQKQYDGGVWENPFIAIWESNSLPELALSPIHRKSIMYMPASSYLASGLGKWATFAFNNEMIRKASSRNQISVSGHDFMKKMTNHRWIIPNLDITNGGQINYSGHTYYDETIHQYVRIDSIERIGIELINGEINNVYNIGRTIVNKQGQIDRELTTQNEQYLNSLQNTINTNYDLWKVLGGEYSVSLKTNGITNFLDWSEASIEKVARVASEVSIRRSNKDIEGEYGYESTLSEIREKSESLYNSVLEKLTNKFSENVGEVSYLTQSFYLQPMKHSDIHYVAPESAIKNGSANINPSQGYNLSNFQLNKWSVSSLHLGIQLNADHHVDNSEVSEMSQVISALAQLGTTHDIANLAYRSIGQSVANNLSNLNINLNSEADEVNDHVYYILGKELCKSFVQGKGWEDISLANAYLSLVLAEFGKNYEDWKKKDPKFKLPFDDPNIFGAFYNSFASGKNKEAIKRRYSGLQAVLTPSQDFNTLYNIDGKMYSYEDLLNDETKTDIDGNRLFANASERLAELDVLVDVSEITPGDYVRLDGLMYMVQGFNGGPKIDTYIDNPAFDMTAAAFDENYNESPTIPQGGKVGLSYIRSLRGQQVEKLGSQGTNLKNANHIIYLSNEESANIKGGYSKFDIWDLDSAKLSHNLEKLNPYLSLENGEITLNTKLVTDPNLLIEITELFNIFKEVEAKSIIKWKENKFNQDYDNNLNYINDIIQLDLDNISINKVFPIPRHLRIESSDPVIEANISSVTYDPYQVMIGATQASSYGLQPGDSIQEILNRKEQFFLDRFTQNRETLATKYDVYFVNHNGNHLHVLYNSATSLKTLNSLKATPLDIETETEGNTTYRIIDGKRAYTINESSKWYQVPLGNGQVYEYVLVEGANELKGVLNSGIYDSVSENKKTPLINLVANASSNELNPRDRLVLGLFKLDPSISSLDKREIKNISTAEQFLDWSTRKSDKETQLKNAQKRYQSFLQYLDFIVARIPAQSMQSFMNMRVAGFINTPTNIALVPSTQFWLQGSDLDIDKAFMLGASISESGYYNDWSELFNYSSKETVDASNELPIPDKKIRVLNEDIQYGYGITEDGMMVNLFTDEYGYTFDTTGIQMLSLDNYTDQTSYKYDSGNNILEETRNNPNKIVTLSKLIGRIQNAKVKELNLNQELLDLINNHTSAENLDEFKLNEALKNKIWYQIKKSGEEIRNFYAQMNPITLDDAQRAAASSSSGKDSNIISLLNTATIMMLELENSVGKDCIGISATGSKVAAAILQHYNELARRVNSGELLESDLFIPKKVYNVDKDAQGLVSKPTFTNINWTNNQNLVNNQSPNSIYNQMLNFGIPADILNQISILISISTDNAKELILQKIGATKDLMSIYVYGLLIGEDFAKIAEFMTKPEISMVQKKSVASLLDDNKKEMNLAKSVSYYQEKVDPKMFQMNAYLGGLDELYKLNFSNTSMSSKIAIRDKANEILKYRAKTETQFADLTTAETIKFDDIISGQVTDIEILKMQKEMIDLLLNQATTQELTISRIVRKEEAKSRYGSSYLEEQGSDSELMELEQQLLQEEYDFISEFSDENRSINKNIKSYIKYLKEAKNRINDILYINSVKAQADKKKYNSKDIVENNLESIYSNIETLHTLKKDSEGVTLLGRFLSINQGIPTKLVDRLNKMFGIEEAVKNKFQSLKQDSIPPFKLMEFFEDPIKRKIWIESYGKLEEAFNVLQIVAESPHFFEMWNAFVTVQKASNNVSIKSRLTESLARRLKYDKYISRLTQSDVSIIQNFVQDCFVHKFLSTQFESRPINIPSNVTMVYNDVGRLVEYTPGSKESFDLKNTYDRMSFKFWFENNYLQSINNPNNVFLRDLGITAYPNALGDSETIAVLPINMMSSRDVDQDAFTSYSNAFIEIKDIKEKIGGDFIGSDAHKYTNAELFFLYNLLVNKNRPGESSLTKIFDTSIWEYKTNPEKAENIITDYFNFERNLVEDPDLKFSSEDYMYRDLELRFAPYLARNESPSTKYYYKFDENDSRQYYIKEGTRDIEKVQIIPSSLNLPILLGEARTKGFESIMRISEKLKKLIYNNKLEIKFVECHG